MIKIYTKTGDTGESGIVGGKRLKKNEQIFWAMGALDELNALLGVSKVEIKNIGNKDYAELLDSISKIQNDIFQMGSEIATLHHGVQPELVVSKERVFDIEKQIDTWSSFLPELDNFVCPGGSKGGAVLHQARTVCRRVEREVVALSTEKELRSDLHAYLNRLGDWLFVAARYVNMLADEVEDKVK